MKYALLKDASGDWNLAEVGGGLALVALIVGLLKQIWLKESPDLQGFGLGVAAIITAVGATQRLRGDVDIDKENLERGVLK